MENLDDGQREALEQFKRNVADVLSTPGGRHSDVWLVKWLRCHSYNLKKTEAFFRANRRAREVYELDSLLDTYVRPEVAAKYEFTSSLGIAKDGSPVRYTRIGSGDYNGFLMSLSGYEVSYYCTYFMEYDLEVLRRENQKSCGSRVHEVTYVLDLEGLALTQLMRRIAIESALDLLQMMQDHYPEVWGNILIVNAPAYFDTAFRVFKPILRLNMLQKIRVASRESTPVLLLKFIDEDVLPVFLGGKKTDSSGDPRCTQFVKFGGRVPEELHVRRRRPPLLETDRGATSALVAARSILRHCVEVRRGDSRIRVEIRSESGSIGLQMLFRPPDGGPEDDEGDLYVSPLLRMQSHLTPVDHTIRAPWPGTYIFRFDNTHSWFTSKKIIFRIRVSAPRTDSP